MRQKLRMNMTIAGILAMTILIGCGQNASTGSESKEAVDTSQTPAWSLYADEPIELDWYVNYSWFVTGWGDNLVSQKITEETGVSINFITPIGNEEEKLSALIASDSLPDIITLGWWENQYMEMIKNGQVYALNELADQYDLYFYQVADATVIDWYTLSDGNFYAYPNSSYTPKDVEENDKITSNQTFLVRKDIYEAIGSPDMSTPEGFADAVRKAAEMFPEVGGRELIPIGAHIFDDTGCVSFDQYLQNFLAVPFEKDGLFYDRNTDEEYLVWLKMFRQLGEEGYLKNDIFVDSRTQTNEKLEEGRYFCLMYQWTDMTDQEKIRYANDPDSVYIAVEGPRNTAGDDPVLPTSGVNGWTATLISKNCEHPERAIALFDYLISEHGQKMVSLGIEGVTYDEVDGKYVTKPEVLELLYSDRDAYNATYGADDTYWMFQDNVMQMQWTADYEEPIKQMAEWTRKYATYTGQYETTIPEDSEYGTINKNIDFLWSQTLKKLLLAKTEEEFDSIVLEYVQKRDAYGWEKLQQEMTRQVNENKQKLGLDK